MNLALVQMVATPAVNINDVNDLCLIIVFQKYAITASKVFPIYNVLNMALYQNHNAESLHNGRVEPQNCSIYRTPNDKFGRAFFKLIHLFFCIFTHY